MKTFLLIYLMIVTSSIFATMEHQAGFESKPSAQRLSKSRGCFAEIQDLGCTHPREGQEKFNTCLSENFNGLNSSCQAFFKKLYGDKTSDLRSGL